MLFCQILQNSPYVPLAVRHAIYSLTRSSCEHPAVRHATYSLTGSSYMSVNTTQSDTPPIPLQEVVT